MTLRGNGIAFLFGQRSEMGKATRQDGAWFSQKGYRCRLDWGRRGARAAAERGNVLVVVDTLSFSTPVATACDHGVLIYPCLAENKYALAEQVNAEIAVGREEVPHRGKSGLFAVPAPQLPPASDCGVFSAHPAFRDRWESFYPSSYRCGSTSPPRPRMATD